MRRQTCPWGDPHFKRYAVRAKLWTQLSGSPPAPRARLPSPVQRQASLKEEKSNGTAPPALLVGKGAKAGKRKQGNAGAQRNGGGGGDGGTKGTRRKRWKPEELDPMIAAEDAELKVRSPCHFVRRGGLTLVAGLFLPFYFPLGLFRRFSITTVTSTYSLTAAVTSLLQICPTI